MNSSKTCDPDICTLRWTAGDLASLNWRDFDRTAKFATREVVRVSDDLDVWDAWPLANATGAPVSWRGGELWFALAALVDGDPELRHGLARIHCFHHVDGAFRHLGPTLPEGFSPGSREWSGCARMEDGRVALYFTAAGTRGQQGSVNRQRLLRTRGALSDGDRIFAGWEPLEELIAPGTGPYMCTDLPGGGIGTIKAFRDPFAWTTAAGREILLFTGSAKTSSDPFNGVIGLAHLDASGAYRPLPPLIDATGLNNELERPHIVAKDGLLYLFWSTQASVFTHSVKAPTGLYGAVADRIEGPWTLLNSDGLVFANPQDEPFQAYSWWVLPDMRVTSFVDYCGIGDPDAEKKPQGRTHFGGTFAPFLRIELDGANTRLD